MSLSPRDGPHPLPLYLGSAQFSKTVQANPIMLQQMIAGIQKYQRFERGEAPEPLPVLWQEGALKLFYAAGGEECGASIILVPSLINKSNIFDLHPQQSFVRYLAAQGVNVYLLDWGECTSDDMQQNLEALIMRRLLPALAFAKEHSKGDLYALGYCMGGTILAAGAQHFEDLAGVCFLAAPWDFTKSHAELLRLINGPFNPVQYFETESGDSYFSQKSNCPQASYQASYQAREFMPASYLQSLFASLDPDRAVEKFAGFLEADEASQAAQLFVAAEDWLNDGVDLPRDIAAETLEGWFGNNTPCNEAWSIGGEIISPHNIEVRALVIASKKDRLVSFESASVMAEMISGAALITPACGHIGMMAGRKAQKEVWEPILRWIKQGA